MAKKKNDLFEILGARSKAAAGAVKDAVVGGGASSSGRSTPSRAPARRKRAASPKTAASNSVSSRSAASTGAAGLPTFSGLTVAAAACVCLLIGFAVGRWSSPEPAEAAGDLNASARRAASEGDRPASPLDERGTRPGSFSDPAPAVPDLDDDEIVESLSPYAFALLPFPALDSSPNRSGAAFQDARRLARWLWTQGFPDVRLRWMTSRKSQQGAWVVVDYTQRHDDSDEYERLAQLDSPAFAPRLADWIARRKVVRLKHPH